MKICICGGGNLGHVVAGFVAAQKKHEVCLLTRHPEQWSQDLIIDAPAETTYLGHLNGLFCDAKQAVSDADIILLQERIGIHDDRERQIARELPVIARGLGIEEIRVGL